MLKTVGFPSTRTGDQTIINGNLVIGTAGKGIDFSAASHAAGMTSELLNDYEEGTWTPTVTASGGALTSYTATGKYTKIGRLVTCNVRIDITNNGTGSINLIYTLPFVAAADANSVGIFREVNATGVACTSVVNNGTADANLQTYNNTYPGGGGYALFGTISYTV